MTTETPSAKNGWAGNKLRNTPMEHVCYLLIITMVVPVI